MSVAGSEQPMFANARVGVSYSPTPRYPCLSNAALFSSPNISGVQYIGQVKKEEGDD